MKSDIPIPGHPVRGSKTGKPIMALFDLLGRNWALGVVWQLADGPLTFRALQLKCEGVSPTALNTRLKELTVCGLVTRDTAGYTLTPEGKQLYLHLKPLGLWSLDWAEGF